MLPADVISPPAACLNCGAALHGRFCSACGQRAVEPYPPMRVVLAEWWREMSGWDGRFARTVSTLLRRPGALTVQVLEGHWARYVPPLRLYLLASVLFFLVSAVAPQVLARPQAAVPRSGITINLTDADAIEALTPEQRAAMRRSIERAPWFLKPIFQSAVEDPVRFRGRVLANLPRVAFLLVPVFAAIVAFFYRRRPFSQHLVFALHLHTVTFAAFAVARLSHFTWNTRIASLLSAAAFLYLVAYALVAFRRVYREDWAWVATKAAAIGVVYVLAGVTAMILMVIWSALVQWS